MLLQRFLVEGILGYLLQAVAYVVGMHAISAQKIEWKRAAFVCAVIAILTYLIRNCGLFNFGVHTMLVLLLLNAGCICLCRMSVRRSILGSIVMMVLVLVSELVNMGILRIFYTMEEINALFADPIPMALAAIPGNVLLLLTAVLMYQIQRVRQKRGTQK